MSGIECWTLPSVFSHDRLCTIAQRAVDSTSFSRIMPYEFFSITAMHPFPHFSSGVWPKDAPGILGKLTQCRLDHRHSLALVHLA